MARERLSGSLTSSQNVPPPPASQSTTRRSGTSSRLPVKAKRPILGERTDNLEYAATPRQHVVKQPKSVVMPRLSMSVTKHAAPATPHVQFSPSASQTSTPAAGLNRSRPGHTPHPRRSSVGLGQLGNADESMLMDMSATDFLASESEASEADEVVEEGRPGSGRGIRGAGRLMTPENSQETRGSGLRKQASPPRTITRLPTPPSSQAGDEPVAPKSRVRPRPEPTPPRPSSFAQQQISSLAAPTHDASPNPRRKKSPRPDEQDAPRLQSPFPSTSSTPRMSAPPPPRNRMEVVITQLRKSVETSPSQDNSATPRAVALGTTKKKGRPSVRTPAASKSLSQSTSSKPSRKQQVPATAPPANRRKSTPRTTFKKISPPRTSLPAQKSKRVSGSRSRKSVWPAELKRMVGTLPKPIEPGSPSDDPLLLIADDEATWGTPVAPSRAKPSSSRSKTLSAARVIDFQKPSGSSSRLAPPPTIDGEPVQEYDVPLHGSEPDYYDDQPMWGNESDGGSDMDDVGNDTFVHVKSGAQPHLMLGEGRGSVLPPADIARLGSRSPAVPTITTTTPPRSPEHADSPRSDIATPAWVNERLAGTPRAASAATPRGASIPAHSSPMASIDAHEDNGMDNNAALEVEEHTQEEMNDNATAKMGNTNEEGLEESFLEQNGRMSSPGLLDAGFASSSPAQPLPSVFASTTPALSPVRSLRSIASSPFTAAPGLTKSTTPIHSPMAVRPDTTVPSSTAALIAKLDSVISPRVTTAVEHDQQDGNVDAQDAAVTASSSRASPLPRPTVFASSPIASPVQRRPPQSVASPIQPSSPITRPSAGGDPEPFGALGLFLTPASPGPDDAGPASPTVHTDIDASTTGAVPLSTTPAVSPCRQLAQWSSPTRSTTPLGCPPIGNAADDTRSHPSVEEEAQEEEEEESTTPTAPLPHELSVMSSPRVPKSPLPAILDARLEEDEHDNVDASIDCSEQADQPLAESTTPTAPVPARLASPVQYTSAFSPRFPSSLRMVQQRSPTPAQEADEAAVDPEYSPHTERVAQDQEEARPANPNEDDSSLADITLEGHSADWSLSDDVPSADVTLDGNSADWASSDDEVDDDQPVLPPSEEADITPLEVASHPLEANNGVQTEEREGLAGEALDSADVPDTDEAGQSGQGVDRQTSPEEADDEQDHQEAAEEEDSTDQTDHDEQSASESEEEAPQPSKKIILKVVTRGVVKLEPETESSAVDTVRSPSPVPDLRPHLDIAAETENALQRSTTPAYDPPTRRNVFPTPRSAASMYQALPTSPAPSARSPIVASTSTLAPVLPGSSNDIEGSPEGQEEALPAMAVHTSHRASRLLARSSQRDAEVDEAEQSIRVRSRPSLGDELAESDQSMRSVVEVSSFDPMAAARAAAILKMNHAYIEHGDLSKLDKSRRSATPHRKSFSSSRYMDKTELLHEAELEIVSTRRSRSRSMSRFRGVSEAPTDIALPGAWNGTPQPKRKRSQGTDVGESDDVRARTKTWGVSHWKRLEKVFRAERDLWTQEREVKSMPGGFIGWARRSTFGPPSPASKPRDPMRVVTRFCDEQGITTEKQTGDWSIEMLKTRVEALERHALHRKTKDQDPPVNDSIEPSPKKARVADTPVKKPAAPAPPPSSIRRMFGWVLPAASSTSRPVPAPGSSSAVAAPRRDKGKGRAVVSPPLEVARPAMTEVMTSSTFAPSTLSNSPIPHPSSPAWNRPSAPPPRTLASSPALSSLPLSNTHTQARPTPKTLSAILAASSSSTSSEGSSGDVGRLSLNPSYSQRSSAINKLFNPDKSASTSAATRPIVMPAKRSSSVKDLVKSFEESGVLSRSHSRDDLQRVPSRPV